MNKQTDARDFTRASIKIDTELISGETSICGQANDVSLNGLFLVCDEHLPVASECSVTIFLGERHASQLCVRATGRVARLDEHGMGVEFTGLDMESHDHLRNLVLFNANNVEQVNQEFRSHLGLKHRE